MTHENRLMLLYPEVSNNHSVCGDTRLHGQAVAVGGGVESLWDAPCPDGELSSLTSCLRVGSTLTPLSFTLTCVIYSFISSGWQKVCKIPKAVYA